MKRYRYLILINFVLILLLYSSAFAAIKCDICNKNISGKYYSGPDNTTYCSDCYSKYDICSSCGKLSKSSIIVGDYKFCSSCFIKLKKCGLCGKSITGSYVYYPELKINICGDCEINKPRCQRCNRPSNTLTRLGKTLLCENCASEAKTCYSCGDALLRDYEYFEGDETRKYCKTCVARYSPCADCGAPVGSRGSKLDDGRYLCPQCRAEAIFEPHLVTPIKKKAVGFLEGQLRIKVNHKINYELQDKIFLERKSKNMSNDINGLFYRKGDDYNIYVLYGLRKTDMIWVIAHEITHAWQAENCSENMKKIDREGFAQWTAYHAVRYFGHKKYAENMRNGDSVYSSGLNKMLNIEKNGGVEAVMSYIKKN